MKKIILTLSSIALMTTVVNAEEVKAAVVDAVKTEAAAVVAPAKDVSVAAEKVTDAVATETKDAVKAPAAAATEVKMKIKAKEKNGVVKAKVAISHDMLTYDQAKKKGKEANFVAHVTATVGDKVVYDVSTSQFLSKNPLIKFQFDGKKGDELKITYTQLKGEVFFATKKIK